MKTQAPDLRQANLLLLLLHASTAAEARGASCSTDDCRSGSVVFAWIVGFALLYFKVCGNLPPKSEPTVKQAAIVSLFCTLVAFIVVLAVLKATTLGHVVAWIVGSAVAYFLFYRFLKSASRNSQHPPS